jgi:hypothetical protein
MAQSPKVQKFIQQITSPFWSNLFYLKSLPLAFFTGMKVVSLNEEQAVVTIPYKWLNKNPFRSMYFAVQAMAGELSTGVLLMLHLQKSEHPVSMLVIDFQAQFTKKSDEKIYFTCENGTLVAEAIAKTVATGEAVSIPTVSIGRLKDGTPVSEIKVLWSVKRKK